jgi:DNA-binding Lrp family transcriptional regulator
MTATDTRNQSYYSLDNLGDRQARVLEIIRGAGPDGISDAEIARMVEGDGIIAVRSLAARRNELVARGLVERCGTGTDPVSGRGVALWRVVAAVEPLPFPAIAAETAHSRQLKRLLELKLDGYWQHLYVCLMNSRSLTDLKEQGAVIKKAFLPPGSELNALKELYREKEEELTNAATA